MNATRAPLLVFLGLLAMPAARADVINGGFETGDLTVWTRVGDPMFTGVDDKFPHTGVFAAFFGAEGSPTAIAQDVSTQAGTAYTLSFWLMDEGGGPPNSFQVLWNGMPLLNLTDPDVNGFLYQQFVFPGLLGAGPTTTLEFSGLHENGFFELDDVNVTPAAITIPELGTAALLLAGALVLAAARRRQAPLEE